MDTHNKNQHQQQKTNAKFLSTVLFRRALGVSARRVSRKCRRVFYLTCLTAHARQSFLKDKEKNTLESQG